MPTLDWIGKKKVVNHHLDVPFKVLNKKYTYSADGKTQDSDNRIIHGDNLEALKALLPEFEGKIKCIYIDPPYNTGNENWVYNDNVNDPRIKKWLGEVVGQEGEDLTRHDKWLCMMYPRLKLLQKLLSDDGAIFISIDDNEQANLKLICDEIFGSGNFVASAIWKKKTNGNNMGIMPAIHDYVLVYTKNINKVKFAIKLSEEYIKSKYGNPDNDPRGPWTTTDLSANHKGPHYAIENPKTKEIFYPPEGRYWVFNEEETKKRIADGRIIFGKTGTTRPVQKVFASNRDLTKNPDAWFDKQAYNSDAMLELTEIIGRKVFDFPKPVKLIQYILDFASDKDSIILDSFAGSGTTAHAVLNMNKADGGNRKFILIEMMDYAESITAERVKRVINGYGSDKNKVEGTGGDFSFYELGEPLLVDGLLNEKVDVANIREYIWFTEVHKKMVVSTGSTTEDNEYFLGKNNDVGYWFYYKKNEETCLNYNFLNTMKTKADQYIIYADVCRLPDSFLKEHNIVFKKIPREIQKF